MCWQLLLSSRPQFVVGWGGVGKDFVILPPLLKFEYQYLKKHVGWCQIFGGDDVVSGSLLPLHSGEAPNSVSGLSIGADSRSKTLWDPVIKNLNQRLPIWIKQHLPLVVAVVCVHALGLGE